MAESFNPYAGAADSFSKGMSQGQQFAEGMAGVELKMKTLAQDQVKLEETKRQHNFEVGKWTTDTVGKLLDEPNGKTKNLRIEMFRRNMVGMGYPDPEVLSTMLVDPTQTNLLRGNLNKLADPNLPDKVREEILTRAAAGLTDKEVVEKLKETDGIMGDILKNQLAEKEKRATEVAKAGVEKPEKLLQMKQNTTKLLSENDIFKNYSKVRVGVANLENYLKNPTPVTDVASLYSMVKAMDPSTGVREGELTIANAANSFSGRIKLFVQKMIVGDALTPEQRQQILNLGQTNLKTSLDAYDKYRTPIVKGATKAGLDPTEFDPAAAFIDTDKNYLKQLDDKAKKERTAGPPVSARIDPARQRQTVINVYDQASPGLVGNLMKFKGRKMNRAAIETALGKKLPDDLATALEIK